MSVYGTALPSLHCSEIRHYRRHCGHAAGLAGAQVRGLMALSWLNLPCAPKAAIRIGKRKLGDPASLPRPKGPRQGGYRCCGSPSESAHDDMIARPRSLSIAFLASSTPEIS